MSPDEHSRKPLKQLAVEIFHEVMAEIEVGPAFLRKVRREGSVLRFGGESVDLGVFRRIWVVSFGKAGWATHDALREVLGEEYAPERGVLTLVNTMLGPQNT